MSGLKIQLFGHVQAELDGQPVIFQTEKVKALLILLATDPHQQYPRGHIASLLYPDYTTKNARTNLRQLLSLLRDTLNDREVDPPYLTISRQALQFNADNPNIAIDTNALQHIISIAHTLTDSERVPQYEQAIVHYQGEFVAYFSLDDSDLFENWVAYRRAKFHAHILQMIEQLLQYYEAQSDWRNVRRLAQILCSIEPLQENGHCYLMLSYARLGKRNQALAQFETSQTLFYDELGVDLSPQFQTLAQQIRDDTLPEQSTPADDIRPLLTKPTNQIGFIGRDVELHDLQAILAQGKRLVTIVGLGGMGKTTLAHEILVHVYDNYADGAISISVAELTDETALLMQMLQAFAIPASSANTPYATLRQYLHEKELLILLDNVEADSKAQIDLITRLLADVPTVQILATSRLLTHIPQEQVFRLQGFEVEQWQTLDQAIQSDAVKLFLQVATQTDYRFTLQHDDLDTIYRICHFVSGMPLGIRLAATWTNTLTVSQIGEEIQSKSDFLDTTYTGRAVDQHTRLQTVFDYSWQRLSLIHQEHLQRLTIFMGHFMFEMAQEITGLTSPVLRDLISLSLVNRVADDAYALHPMIKVYLLEKSEEQAHQDTLILAYITYYLGWLHRASDDLTSRHQLRALDALERQLSNIQQAWEYAITRNDYLLIEGATNGLYLFSMMRSHYVGGEGLLARASDAITEKSLQSYLLLKRHWLLRWRTGIFSSEAVMDADRVYEMAQENSVLCALALSILGDARPEQYPQALQTAHNIYEAHADSYNAAWMYHLLAQKQLYSEGVGQAIRTQYQSLRLRQMMQDRIGMVYSMYNLSTYHLLNGDLVESRYYASSMLEFSQQLGEKSGQILANTQLGFLAFFYHDADSLARYLAQSSQLVKEINHPLGATHNRLLQSLQAIQQRHWLRAGEYATLAQRNQQPYTQFLADWINTVIALSLGQMESAKQYLQEAYYFTTRTQSDGVMQLCVPLAMLLAHHNNDMETVSTLYADMNWSQQLFSWLNDWQPFITVADTLQGQSGKNSEGYGVILGRILSAS